MADIRIEAVETFLTQPQGSRLIVVRVRTNQPGLYGLGCATFTQRHKAVAAAIEHHIGPCVTRRDPREITPLVARRLVDFVRIHLSQIGGITPALKLAHLCEAFGVRFAWHGPGDVSPVGMAAALHLDVGCRNFGVQEWALRSPLVRDIFPGTPEIRDGKAWPNDRPGLGIDFDESLAAGYPCDDAEPAWTGARLPDGTQ
ncbi:MAG: enolase C-terminal domain-like protein [bacterium]